jgi:hypothetical protein
LERKIKDAKIPKLDIGNNNIYKYLSCKLKISNIKKEPFKTCDVIITNKNLFFLNYDKSKFEFLFNINIKNLTKLAFSKHIPNCLILHDNKDISEGIEIKTESSSSLLTLIDDLFHNYPEHL